MDNSLRELIKSLIEAELKKLKYDEPSLHRPDDLSEDNNAQISALQKELNVLNQQLSNINSNSSIPVDKKPQRLRSIQNKIKNKKDRIQKLKNTKQTEGEEELEEMSSVNAMGGGDSFMTPHAFSKPGSNPKKKKALSTNTWDIVESVKENINEAQQSSWEKFLLTIEATAESNVKDFLFDPLKEPYIDTPGDFHIPVGNRGRHRGTVLQYMKQNMGSSEYQKLYNFYKKYKIRCDAFVKKFGKAVNIVESVNFRDPELSPKKKIAYAVREVRKQLAEVEKMIDNSAAFKENAGLKSSDFYKRTHSHLRKIGEHITRIMNKMQTIK